MKLLVIEDDRMLAHGIRDALMQSGYVVELAASAAEAMQATRRSRFDVCILDLGLPDRDGIDVLRALRSENVTCPVLILSAREQLGERISGLDAGADDYLVKPFALGELEARLRALIRRKEDYTASRALGHLRFDFQKRRVLVADAEVELTRRELAVFEMLIAQPGRVVSKPALFDAVFSSEAHVADNALEVQVSRLRQKLKGAGVTIRALRGLGYRLEESLHGDENAA